MRLDEVRRVANNSVRFRTGVTRLWLNSLKFLKKATDLHPTSTIAGKI